MVNIEIYSKKQIYTIIECKEIYKNPPNDPQVESFIGFLDVFHIAYKQLLSTEQEFLMNWSDGLSNIELSRKYNVEIESIYKRKQRLVDKIHKLLNEN